MDSCEKCDGRCCQKYIVPLTPYDVGQIQCLGHHPYTFIEWVSVSEFSCEYPDIRLESGYHYMVLKRNSKHCIFFNKKENKCEIHGSHPILCRIYPFDPYIRGVRQKHLCDSVRNFTAQELEHFCQEENNRLDFFEKAISWNSTNKKNWSPHAFLKYMGLKEKS